MNVETITMDPQQAQAKMLAYRKALRRRKAKEVREEYGRLEQAYSELAAGRTLINPIEAIRHAGFNDEGLPKLAIARADRKFVRYRYWRHRSEAWFNCSRFDLRNEQARHSESLHFELNRWPGGADADGWSTRKRAMVPLIPVDVRPDGQGSEKDWHILFEAEWEPDVAPVDPILLRRIHGDLFAVLAAWDLTPIERSVLAAMRSGEIA